MQLTRHLSPHDTEYSPHTRKLFSDMTNEYPDAGEVALDDSRFRR